MAGKLISFKVQGNGGSKDPRWHKVKTENTMCPQCIEESMVVIMSANPGQEGHFLYAYCPRCKDYFIGE